MQIWKLGSARAMALCLMVAGIIAIGLWPAIVNGFPFVFYDSNVYIDIARTFQTPFPVFYSAFVFIVSRVDSLFGLVFVQLAVSAYVLFIAFRRLAGATTTVAAALILPLLALTQLPWLVSWIMPDFLGGVGALALITVALSERRNGDDVALCAVVVLSALVATANLIVLLPLALILLCGAHFAGVSRLTGRKAIAAVSVVVVAVGVTAVTNTAITHKAGLVSGAPARAFARLADIRLAQRYLHAECPSNHTALCDELPELDKLTWPNEFMWGAGGLATRVDAWADTSGLVGRTNKAIILTYPAAFVGAGVKDTVALLGATTLGGEELASHAAPGDGVRSHMSMAYPKDLPAFEKAAQQRGTLSAKYPATFYKVVAEASYVLIALVFCMSIYRRDWLSCSICVAVIAAIVGSAFVSAALSTPAARYNVKMTWLALFAIEAAAFRMSAMRLQILRITEMRTAG